MHGADETMNTDEKSIETSLLLSNVIDEDHQKCFYTQIKGKFALLLWTFNWLLT